MTLFVILGSFVLLGLPGLLDRCHSLGPAHFARLGRASMMLGFIGVVLGLAAWGAPAILHLADAVGVPGLCDEAVHRLPLGGLELAIAAAAIAVAVTGRALAAVRRARLSAHRARVDPCFGRHRRVGRYDVVVIPSAQLVAVGVPGDRPQIVLSQGLVAALSPVEVDAVIRHEVAHHRLGHRQYLVTAAVMDQVFGWVPRVRSSTRSLRNAVEAWADLESTQSSEARTATLRSALERLATERTTTASRHSIERRIARLDFGDEIYSSRLRSVGAWVPATALALIAAVALLSASQILDAVIRCRV